MYECLLAFIAANEKKPWRPGHVDCCIVLASWAMWIGHRDPAEHLRGSYSSEEEFRHIIEKSGGVVPVVARCISKIHGTPTDIPECGDVGVIGSPGNIQRQFGGIFDGEQWLVRIRDRFSPMTARQLAAWRI